MTALRELIEAVEAGTLDGFVLGVNADAFPEDFGNPDKNVNLVTALDAYHGSVDAALALMQAVLPNYRLFDLHMFDDGDWSAEVERLSDRTGFWGCADNPARALLLTILKAMEAQP